MSNISRAEKPFIIPNNHRRYSKMPRKLKTVAASKENSLKTKRQTRSSTRIKENTETKSKLQRVLKEIQPQEEKEEQARLPVEIPAKDLLTPEMLQMGFLIECFDGTEAEAFLSHCRSFMTAKNVEDAEILTIKQSDTPLWQKLRYGRITASRLHAVSRCKTKNGSLMDSIMGRSRGWSFAMQRGNNLEGQVFERIEKEMAEKGIKVREVGLILDPSLPHFGASPDGLADDFTLEIKCPFTENTHAMYTNVEKLKKEYFAQIQMQMHMTRKNKALLAVADLNFERNGKITKVWIDYDKDYVTSLIEEAEAYWATAVFPALMRAHKRKLAS